MEGCLAQKRTSAFVLVSVCACKLKSSIAYIFMVLEAKSCPDTLVHPWILMRSTHSVWLPFAVSLVLIYPVPLTF